MTTLEVTGPAFAAALLRLLACLPFAVGFWFVRCGSALMVKANQWERT